MLELVKRISYSFEIPYMLIGYRNKDDKSCLELVNGLLLPEEDNRFLLKLYDTDVIERLEEQQHITVSMLDAKMDKDEVKKALEHSIIDHDKMKLPIFSRADHAVRAEILMRQGVEKNGTLILRLGAALCLEKSQRDIRTDEAKQKTLVRVINMSQSKMKSRTKKNEAYHFNFKYKICRLKEQGMTYQDLAAQYGVYHETIKDWYLLYKVFGREGLTKKKAKELASNRIPKEKKQVLARNIIDGVKTYRQILEQENVSLSRIRNWVKKERHNRA